MTDLSKYHKQYCLRKRELIEDAYKRLRSHFSINWLTEIRDRQNDDIITINAWGTVFQVYKATLARYPDTLLSNKDLLQPFWIESRQQYFVNRNPSSVAAILRYYRSGDLTKPKNVKLLHFLNDLIFFKLDQSVITSFLRTSGFDISTISYRQADSKWFSLMEKPMSSIPAFWIAAIRAIVIMGVVVTEIELLGNPKTNTVIKQATIITGNVMFDFDLIIRVCKCPRGEPIRYFKNYPIALIDAMVAIAFIPLFVLIVRDGFTEENDNRTSLSDAAVIILFSLQSLQLFRISRLFTNNRILVVAIRTIKLYAVELFRMLVIVVVISSVVGSIMYIFESHSVRCPPLTNRSSGNNESEDFDWEGSMNDIPVSIWWTIITVFTVGYGDIVPSTAMGYIFGLVVIYISIMVSSIIVPFLCDIYDELYKNDEEMELQILKALRNLKATQQ